MEFVVPIAVAIIALIAVLGYIQVTRVLDNLRGTLGKVDSLLDEVKTTTIELRGKLEIIDKDLQPLMRTLDKTLTDANPVVKSLGNSSEDIRLTLENVRKTVVEVAEVADGIHQVIMPAVQSVKSLISGLNQGIRSLSGSRNGDGMVE